MPLYDFSCRACGASFEAHVPVDGHAPCPVCAGVETERVVSGFAGPFRVGLRGGDAKRADARRRARAEQRREQSAQRRSEPRSKDAG